MDAGIRIREARAGELEAVAGHYYGMRLEIGWNDAELEPDWKSRFVAAYERGALAGELRYFVAEADGKLIGSAVSLIKRSVSESYAHAPRTGYIVNVYVDTPYRRRGAARALTIAGIEWLKMMDCSVVRLQASRAGRPLYASMGFTPSGEMELTL